MKNIELMREYMRLVEAGEKEPWKHFEKRIPGLNTWSELATNDWFTQEGWIYRWKPKTININGFEVPEPVKEPLEVMQDYYSPMFPTGNVASLVWVGNRIDMDFFNAGMIHLTKEAAIQHAKALLSFTEVKNDD